MPEGALQTPQDNFSPGRDWNPGHPEYKEVLLTTNFIVTYRRRINDLQCSKLRYNLGLLRTNYKSSPLYVTGVTFMTSLFSNWKQHP